MAHHSPKVDMQPKQDKPKLQKSDEGLQAQYFLAL